MLARPNGADNRDLASPFCPETFSTLPCLPWADLREHTANPEKATHKLRCANCRAAATWGHLSSETRFFLGNSAQSFSAIFHRLLRDPSVEGIVPEVDSPGGMAGGVDRLATEIFEARSRRKPIMAVANKLIGSGAYWIASAADEIVASPTAQVGGLGSLGCIATSRKRKKAGLKVALISLGRYKTEGNPFESLSGEGRGAIQRQVS